MNEQNDNKGKRPLPEMKIRIKQAMRRQTRGPISIVELGQMMRLTGTEYKEFEKTIPTLITSGEIIARNGKLSLAQRDFETLTGQVVRVNGTYGFVRLDDREEDVFVPGRRMRGAMPGDGVTIKVSKADDGRYEGEIAKIDTQGAFRFTGIISRENGKTEIIPDKNMRIPITLRREDESIATTGDKVLAQLDSRGMSHFDHTARILLTFGSSQKAKSCCDAILAAADIRREFPEEVVKEAQKLSDEGIHPKEMESRLDLRGEKIFTIDSADTKDIDDAISLQKTDTGWHLGVHIADVSHYVHEAGVIDVEALERGTSVYFANSVVPMLPAALSNGICSLNPQEDRLAFSALMELGPKGELLSYDFKKTVIRSRLKGVYKEINAIMDGSADEELLAKYAELHAVILQMEELAHVLLEKRDRKGGLDLESVESKLVLDEDGVCIDILPRERGFSEQMIEEFMLLANESAATFAVKNQLPFVYRIHDLPSPEKVETLKSTLDAVGIPSKGLEKGATPHALFVILQAAKGSKYQKLVNNTLLRSMAKAKYSENNIGHFGLVLDNYAHFTSPIRRYPDLMIHRIMGTFLSGTSQEETEQRYQSVVPEVSLQSSNREVAAMTAERDCDDCYKAEYMLGHLGAEFDGVISGAAGHGVYVELANTVEGLIRMDKLPEGSYEYDGRMTIIETVTGKTYRVGDPARIQVLAADVSSGNVDFALVQPE